MSSARRFIRASGRSSCVVRRRGTDPDIGEPERRSIMAIKAIVEQHYSIAPRYGTREKTVPLRAVPLPDVVPYKVPSGPIVSPANGIDSLSKLYTMVSIHSLPGVVGGANLKTVPQFSAP